MDNHKLLEDPKGSVITQCIGACKAAKAALAHWNSGCVPVPYKRAHGRKISCS